MTNETFRSDHAALLRPSKLLLGVAYALYAAAPVVVALAAMTRAWGIAILLVHCIIFGTLARRHGLTSTKNAAVERGTVNVTGGDLCFRGNRIATRSELRQAFVVTTKEMTFVRLERHGKSTPLFVRVAHADEGDALVRALGLDAKSTAAEMTIASTLLGMPIGKQLMVMLLPVVGFVASFIVLAGLPKEMVGPIFGAGIVALVAYVLTMTLAPTSVRIGTDGVEARWLGQRRFYAFTAIQSFQAYVDHHGTKVHHGVELRLRDGTFARLPTGQGRTARDEASRLLHRIRAAHEARSAGHVARTTDLLARTNADTTEWIRALKRVGAGAFDHRRAAVRIDDLLAVVEDASLPPLQRASAAVAAVASGEEDASRRVRVAASATASPELRKVLARIADTTEEEELAAALDEVERGQKRA